MADGGYSRRAEQGRLRVKNLKKKYRKIPDGNKTSGNQRQEWEMIEIISGPCY